MLLPPLTVGEAASVVETTSPDLRQECPTVRTTKLLMPVHTLQIPSEATARIKVTGPGAEGEMAFIQNTTQTARRALVATQCESPDTNDQLPLIPSLFHPVCR